ncbi:MAG: SRPBCC domain-containing protein [Candidatus Dormibacteria bacterium]
MLVTRKFDAPAEQLFDVLTKPQHVRLWFTGGGENLEICDIDLRVGGEYRQVGVFPDGVRCSFHGTYLEIEPPVRTVETWVFDGRPEAEAVETVTLREEDGVTTMTVLLAFKHQLSRDSMFEHAPEQRDDAAVAIDGMQASYDKLEDLITTLA